MATKVWIGGSTSGTTSWSVAANWSPSGVPAAGDDIIVPATAAYAIAGYDTSGTKMNSFTVEEGYALTIGGTTTALKIDFTDETDKRVTLGGSGKTYLDINGADDIEVRQAGASTSTGQYDLNIKGTGNANLFYEPSSSAGRCGVAAQAGQTAGFQKVYCNSGVLKVGSGVSNGTNGITLASVSGGQLTLEATAISLELTGGQAIYRGTDAVMNVDIWAGSLSWDSPANITNLNISGTVDFTASREAKTVTTTNIYQGGVLRDSGQAVSEWTNGIRVAGTSLANVTIDLGRDVTIKLAA